MKPIPLTRCVFLMPFNELLADIGTPTTSLLAKFHLPTSLEEKADQYVPLLPTIRLRSPRKHLRESPISGSVQHNGCSLSI